MADLAEITVTDAKELLDSNKAVLVDCREQDEWDQVRISGAKLIPLSVFDPAQLPEYSGKTLILQCQSGARSGRLGLWLIQNGYENIANMQGGIKAWAAEGLPIEK
ncbi:MAG: rhodanese-like domain-containing protein [Alphaproteobacteria bacterium]